MLIHCGTRSEPSSPRGDFYCYDFPYNLSRFKGLHVKHLAEVAGRLISRGLGPGILLVMGYRQYLNLEGLGSPEHIGSTWGLP